MLSVNDMQKLLVRFPKVELSYDKVIHKKVYSDYCQAIPYGKKYFAWFTHYKDEDVCIFLETNYNFKLNLKYFNHTKNNFNLDFYGDKPIIGNLFNQNIIQS